MLDLQNRLQDLELETCRNSCSIWTLRPAAPFAGSGTGDLQALLRDLELEPCTIWNLRPAGPRVGSGMLPAEQHGRFLVSLCCGKSAPETAWLDPVLSASGSALPERLQQNNTGVSLSQFCGESAPETAWLDPVLSASCSALPESDTMTVSEPNLRACSLVNSSRATTMWFFTPALPHRGFQPVFLVKSSRAATMWLLTLALPHPVQPAFLVKSSRATAAMWFFTHALPHPVTLVAAASGLLRTA